MNTDITEDEVYDWLQNETTKKIRKLITEIKMEYEKSLANGFSITPSSAERTAIETAKVVGIIAGLSEFLAIDLKDSIESLR